MINALRTFVLYSLSITTASRLHDRRIYNKHNLTPHKSTHPMKTFPETHPQDTTLERQHLNQKTDTTEEQKVNFSVLYIVHFNTVKSSDILMLLNKAN